MTLGYQRPGQAKNAKVRIQTGSLLIHKRQRPLTIGKQPQLGLTMSEPQSPTEPLPQAKQQNAPSGFGLYQPQLLPQFNCVNLISKQTKKSNAIKNQTYKVSNKSIQKQNQPTQPLSASQKLILPKLQQSKAISKKEQYNAQRSRLRSIQYQQAQVSRAPNDYHSNAVSGGYASSRGLHFRNQKLQRLPISVNAEDFHEYGGKAMCSNHIFNFKIVGSASELDTPSPFFHPKYTHQIYNSDETLRGHDDPRIEVFLSASSLRPYLQWTSRCKGTYSENAKSSCFGNHDHKEDDIEGRLASHFGRDALITSREVFIAHLNSEIANFKQPGRLVAEFTREIQQPPEQTKSGRIIPERRKATYNFKVFKVNASHSKFIRQNHHLQALLQYYIEGASFIPLDDIWNYFLVYLDKKLVAFATTFEEYLKVPKAAVTISQVLVLPPYQKYGIGSALLKQIYSHYLKDKRCTLIIVEDPAHDFQRMKDVVDIGMILQAGFFKSMHSLDPKKHLDLEKFKTCSVLDHKEVTLIKTKLKLPKDNILRCFELLLLAYLEPNDSKVHEAYRKSVLKKFADFRDLLKPYFRFENFAERSMYTINDPYEQDATLREKCCLGNGQLACFENSRTQDGRAYSAENGQLHSSPILVAKHCGSNSDNGTTSCGLALSKSKHGGLTEPEYSHIGYPKMMTPTQSLSRCNRFAPTPWHEVQGNQVRYELPKTLQQRIKAAFKHFIDK